MGKLVSVVVPVYKVEKYLRKCVDSIVNQSYQNLEIILVDDGSPDMCGKICDEYAQKDSRIKVVHKKNGGLSDARNEGIKNVNGDYLMFVDSDDYISKEYVKLMLDVAQETNGDIIIGKTVHIDETGLCMKDNKEYPIEKEYTAQEALEVIFWQKEFDTNACGKLYRSTCFKENFFKKGILYEDFELIYKIIDKCQKIIFVSGAEYYYLHREDSIMSSRFDERKLILIEIAETILSFIEKKYPDIREAAIRRYVYSNFHLLGRALNDNDYTKEAEQMRKNILKYRREMIRSKKVNKKEKMAIVFLCMGNRFYKMTWNIFAKMKGKSI